MDINPELVRRAQMLLTLDHSLPQVKQILLREGYRDDQVNELIDATEEVLNYFIPPTFTDDKIAIDIRHSKGEMDIDSSPDIIIDRINGKIEMLTPHLQETWRVASEIRKTIRPQYR
ncbi:MAG: hypothetical protein APF84_10110 [Gracilibacter sp. BRH_c7a]|nr:MAG: hypothetical protein APF84_10110 [Gracilibacter sp. BRH_c7a]